MWIFDLDHTLYPPERGLLAAVNEKIRRFILQRMQISVDEAEALRRRLWQQYGTTARGIRDELKWPLDDYFTSINIENIEDYIDENIQLRRVLESIPDEKAVFTNGQKSHAERVLRRLGITDCFKCVVSLPDDLVGKPDPKAFDRLSTKIGQPLKDCLMFDDDAESLKEAKRQGMKTIYVGAKQGIMADYTMTAIDKLKDELENLISRLELR